MKILHTPTITPDLTSRSTRAEYMDDPGCDREQLHHTLRNFERINTWVARTPGLFGRMLAKYLSKESPRTLTVADIGGGGGDFCRWLWKYCTTRGIEPRIYCIDSDPRVTEYARKKCHGFPGISVLDMDAHEIDTIGGPIDFITANHFLHHLPDERIPGVLRKISAVSRRGFLINDLHRCRAAYLSYLVLASLFFRNGFTFDDGLISIRRGFTRNELQSHVEQAGIGRRVSVRKAVPFRIVVSALYV